MTDENMFWQCAVAELLKEDITTSDIDAPFIVLVEMPEWGTAVSDCG
jgi:hypothetical protein